MRRGTRITGAVVAGAAAVGAAAVLAIRMSPRDPGRRERAGLPVRTEPTLLARLAAWAPPPPATTPGRLAAYLWASPLSAAGLLLAAAGGSRFTLTRGVVVATAARGPVGAMLGSRGFAATTLGHVVVTTATTPSSALLAHELVHVRQAERLGVAFGPLYVGLLAVYGYRRHPMERAARSAGASPGAG